MSNKLSVESVTWITAANAALQASEKMRQLQAQQVKRVVGVAVSSHGGSFVLKAVQESTATSEPDVTII